MQALHSTVYGEIRTLHSKVNVLCVVHFVANMFDKFAAVDAKNAARAKSLLNRDGKDVFTRAEEEAKATFTDETTTESTDETKNISETVKDKSDKDKEKGKLEKTFFQVLRQKRKEIPKRNFSSKTVTCFPGYFYVFNGGLHTFCLYF